MTANSKGITIKLKLICSLLKIKMGSDDGEDTKIGRHRLNKTWTFFLGSLALFLLIYMDTNQLYVENSQSSAQQKNLNLRMSSFEKITDFAEYKANNGLIILSFVSFSYRLNAINWAMHMEKLRISNYAFICLDEEIFNFFKSRRIICYKLYEDDQYFMTIETVGSTLSIETIRSLWVIRLSLLSELLKSGFDVIYSDVDAVWLRNPLTNGEGLLSPHMGDIVASRGQFPTEVSDYWGATLCLGLIYFRSTEAVVSIVDRATTKAKIYKDDQIALNLALLEEMFDDEPKFNKNQSETMSQKQAKVALRKEVSGLRTQPVEFALMKRKGTGFDTVSKLQYIQDKQIAVADIRNVRVALLPHQFVPRCCNELPISAFSSKVFVAHCHVNDCKPAKTMKENWGKAQKRLLIMNKFDSWCLSLSQKLNKNSAQKLTQHIDKMVGKEFQVWFQQLLMRCNID